MPQVIITIDMDGQTTVDAEGYKGASCKEATAAPRKRQPRFAAAKGDHRMKDLPDPEMFH
ncbi:MAG: DUF2997 domain-containing protein [Pirellulaceae bacterium]